MLTKTKEIFLSTEYVAEKEGQPKGSASGELSRIIHSKGWAP